MHTGNHALNWNYDVEPSAGLSALTRDFAAFPSMQLAVARMCRVANGAPLVAGFFLFEDGSIETCRRFASPRSSFFLGPQFSECED